MQFTVSLIFRKSYPQKNWLFYDIFSVYDALTGEIVRKLQNHNACVRDVSWHPYLNEILSSSWDRRIVKWTPNQPDPKDSPDYQADPDDSKYC